MVLEPRTSLTWPGSLLAFPLIVLLALAVSACTKSRDETKPAGLPPISGPAAAQPAAPAASPPASAPSPAAAALPRSVEIPAPPPPPLPDLRAAITGQLTLPAARRADVGRGDVIFLVARRISDGPAPGAVVAVKKLEAETFPLPFTLSAADTMVPGMPFDGEVTITARVDKDRDPMTKRKGDVIGTLKRVKVGDHAVTIALDTVQAADAPPPGGGPPPAGGPHGGMGLPPGHP